MITHKVHPPWITVLALAFAGCPRPGMVPEDRVQPPSSQTEQVQREKPMDEPGAAEAEGGISQGYEDPVTGKKESKVQLDVDVDVGEDGVYVDIGKDGIKVDVDEDGVDVEVGNQSRADPQTSQSDG